MCYMLCLVAQSCPTLQSLDCSPPGSSIHGDSPGKNTGVGCHALLQGSFQPRAQTHISCIGRQVFLLDPSFGDTGFPGGSDGEESSCNAGDQDLIPGLGRFLGGGHGNPLQYSCLENPHGQKNLTGYIHGVAKSQTQLCDQAQHTQHIPLF